MGKNRFFIHCESWHHSPTEKLHITVKMDPVAGNRDYPCSVRFKQAILSFMMT